MPTSIPKHNVQIVGLSRDKKGLRGRVKTMEKGNYWHIHSDEMTPYQRKVHKRLLKKENAR